MILILYVGDVWINNVAIDDRCTDCADLNNDDFAKYTESIHESMQRKREKKLAKKAKKAAAKDANMSDVSFSTNSSDANSREITGLKDDISTMKKQMADLIAAIAGNSKSSCDQTSRDLTTQTSEPQPSTSGSTRQPDTVAVSNRQPSETSTVPMHGRQHEPQHKPSSGFQHELSTDPHGSQLRHHDQRRPRSSHRRPSATVTSAAAHDPQSEPSPAKRPHFDILPSDAESTETADRHPP